MRTLRILALAIALCVTGVGIGSTPHSLTQTANAQGDVCDAMALPVFNACVASQTVSTSECYAQYLSIYYACAAECVRLRKCR